MAAEAFCALGEMTEAGVQIVKIFPGGRFKEPELLHHPILRKALKLRSNTPVPHDYQPRFIEMWPWLHLSPLPESWIC